MLKWQENAGRVDEVNDRYPAPHRHVLDSQDLGDRLRKPAPGLDRCVVRHHSDRAPADATDACDDTRSWRVSPVRVVCDQQAELEKSLGIVQECRHPLASEHLAGGALALDAPRPASLAQTLFQTC